MEFDNCLIKIQQALDDLNGYFGGIIESPFIYRTAYNIRDEIQYHGIYNIPEKIKAKCIDGKVYTGVPSIDVKKQMLQLRCLNEKERLTKEDWENLLVEYGGGKFVYCEQSSRIFHSEDRLAELYLMKHKCSVRIFELVQGMDALTMNTGPYAEVIDTYIRKERSISKKRDSIMPLLDKSQVGNINFAWDYINEQYKKDFVGTQKYSKHQIIERAKRFDIITGDLIYRTSIGMSLDEATELGKQDKMKYGFINESSNATINKVSMLGCTYNLITYIRYKARQEGLDSENWR